MENQVVNGTEATETTETMPQIDNPTESQEPTPAVNTQDETTPPPPPKPDPEIERLKKALDKATHEAAEAKRNLRAKQTAEEQKAEEERERQEALENELAELRKQAAVATITKRVMTFIPDEPTAGMIADALYGAQDVDTAIDEFNRAWTAREKRLKLEYGKFTAPTAGEDSPQISKEDFMAMGYKERLDFKNKYPEAYRALSK